jgi:hypothetical protein
MFENKLWMIFLKKDTVLDLWLQDRSISFPSLGCIQGIREFQVHFGGWNLTLGERDRLNMFDISVSDIMESLILPL